MRRYLPLLLISFLVVVVAVAGTFYAGYAGKPAPEAVNAIVVYTSIPVEQAVVLAQEYEKTAGVKVNILPLTPAEIVARVRAEEAEPRADLVIANSDVFRELKKSKLLEAYASEQTDIIPERFVEAEYLWTGIWYDPIVLVINQDYARKLPQAPKGWNDLTQLADYKLALTDFLAAEAAANLLNSLAAVNGEEATLGYLGKLHPRVVQYAKFLATPPRMTGLGEADIGIAVQSEAVRYVKDGFPVRIIYPEEGTAFLLTGIGLTAKAPHNADAKKFIDWIIRDEAQQVMYNNRFYLIPTNPEAKVHKEYDTKQLRLFRFDEKLDPEQKRQLLDKWVQTVRLSPR